jgi:hypothetical protein
MTGFFDDGPGCQLTQRCDATGIDRWMSRLSVSCECAYNREAAEQFVVAGSSVPMPPAVRALLESFDALSEADRLEAAVEILRRISPGDAGVTDRAFVEVADEAFSILDAEDAEAVSANRQEG